ncbi:MAG: ribonuclease P protein component [Cyanobacteriota bacterium]
MALPGQHRIKGQRAFDFLYQHGRRHHGSWMVIRIAEARPALLKARAQLKASAQQDADASWRCAVVISNKVSKRAVRRNQLRRLLHHHLLRSLPDVPSDRPTWLLISLKPGSADAAPAALLGECEQLLQHAGFRS